MNLGIVIAICDYGGGDSDLPGCKRDGAAISTVLKSDEKFDDVLVISEKTHSGHVKPRLIDFVARYKGEDIDDLVFYFTGHGTFIDDEFYYLLSDYDEKRLRQTSLENTELDNLIRVMEPNNAVKIVDACHSGAHYIKDPDVFEKYLKETKGRFRNCYFLYSSQVEQRSFQDDNLSDFTRSVVESIRSHASEVVRYKDVIDYVSDAFSGNSGQKPFFVVQADFTETFCSVTQSLRESLGELLSSREFSTEEPKDSENKVLERLQEEAAIYCTQAEAFERLGSFREALREGSLSQPLSGLYGIVYSEDYNYYEIPNAASIGKWLDKNDTVLFAKATHVQKTNGLGPLYFEVGGFMSTVELPFSYMQLVASPKLPNLRAGVAFIVPLVSKTTLRIFLSYAFYEEHGWDEHKLGQEVKWSTFSTKLKDIEELKRQADLILKEFSDFLYSPIEEKYSLGGGPESDDSKSDKDPRS